MGEDGSLWGPILEKAFAKYHGNYLHTVGGIPLMAAKTLYGAPSKEVTHVNYTADALWKEIRAAETRGDMIMVGSPSTASGSHNDSQANGISYNHAFTCLGTKELTDAAGKKI